MNEDFTKDYKRDIDAQIIVESFTDDEIQLAISKTGKKGLAWDCLTIWAIKLISITTVDELLEISRAAGIDLEGIDLGWVEHPTIKLLEEEDVDATAQTENDL